MTVITKDLTDDREREKKKLKSHTENMTFNQKSVTVEGE